MSQTDRGVGLTGTLGVKAPCRVATTANITLYGAQTIDGVAVVAEDRVLVRSQTSPVDNGIYYCQDTDWVRAPDFDGIRDVLAGTQVIVYAGTLYAGTNWITTATNPITPGTTSITFVQQINNNPVYTSVTAASVSVIANGATPIVMANAPLRATGSADASVQIDVRNASTGANASSDIVATASDGTDTSKYINMGINGQNYSVVSWTINGARDGYLYTSDGALSIGTAAAQELNFFTGGTLLANKRMSIGSTGKVNIDSGLFTVGGSIPKTENRLVNGGFAVDQLVNAATAVADDVYAHDCWYLLTQTASVQASTQTLQEDGTPHNIRITQNQVASQRFGLAQIIEARNSQDLRAKITALAARVRISNSQALRYAILEWTGTADTVTSDVVLDWTSASYTAGGFFLAANLTVAGVGTLTPAANTWTDLTALSATLSSSVNNIIVMVWTEAVAAQNVTLDVGRAVFARGAYPLAWESENYEITLAKCQRYYQKSFAQGTAPAQNVAAGPSAAIAGKAGATALGGVIGCFFKVTMRIIPTVTTYNPSAANAQIRDSQAAADFSTTAATAADNGIFITGTGAAGTAVGNTITVHWTADARL